MTDGWSVAELAERVADALAGDGVRAPNGRVRDVPDARAIRWYATIGLVDRPLPVPGRTARYGPRHLLQVVAVKRRQAQGQTLAQIQAELAGAPDETLVRVARVPEALLAGADAPATGPTSRPRFWTASAPAPAAPPEPEPTLHPLPAAPPPEPALSVTYHVELPGGATLGLPRPPTPEDLAALLPATTQLLRLLAARGLLDTDRAVLPIPEGDAR
jgi:DNA-binding transcriptional MerR regulator